MKARKSSLANQSPTNRSIRRVVVDGYEIAAINVKRTNGTSAFKSCRQTADSIRKSKRRVTSPRNTFVCGYVDTVSVVVVGPGRSSDSERTPERNTKIDIQSTSGSLDGASPDNANGAARTTMCVSCWS